MRRSRHRRSASIVLLLASACAYSQSPAARQLAPPSLIDQLVANAAAYRQTLPSIIADESITSDASYMVMMRSHATATGTFRVIRETTDGALKESRQIAMLNGHPSSDQHVKLPVTLLGGFGQFQQMFFAPEHRLCFDFFLRPQPASDGSLQIDVISHPATQSQTGSAQSLTATCLQKFAGVTGIVRIDPATHQIVHFERTVPDGIDAGSLATFASVDSVPIALGSDTFWLPSTIVGRIHHGAVRGAFTAHYSNYHRYTASITLLLGTNEVEPDAAPPATPTAPSPPSTPH